MRAQHRFLALAVAALLLLAVAPADEVPSSRAPSSPESGQAPAPGVNSEHIITGKSEASGESENTNPLEQITTGMAPVSFAAAVRSHTDEVNGDVPSSDASNLGSMLPDPLPGDAQSDPALEVAVHSHESQESLDQEVDSEESLASQGM